MNIYNHHPATGEYLGSSTARPDPLSEGDYLIPAHAVTEPPPAVDVDNIPCWTGDKWEVVPDKRGQAYYMPDGQRRVIEALGEELPAGAMLEKPAHVKRQEAINWTDATADRIRAADRSVGQYLDAEYQIVADALVSYRNDPGNEVPEAIQSYAAAEGLAVEAAAEQIAEAAARAVELLQTVRRIRLAGKAAVRDADDEADMLDIARPFIDQLEALATA